jgi:hypothetical protein
MLSARETAFWQPSNARPNRCDLHAHDSTNCRNLGPLMALAGLGWLTYLSTPLANYLSPYNLVFGVLGEALGMLWLLVRGLNAQK